jgi:hypothetical protein
MIRLNFCRSDWSLRPYLQLPLQLANTIKKSWHNAKGEYIEASRVIHIKGQHCIRAPDVGAYASQPYTRPPCEPASWY